MKNRIRAAISSAPMLGMAGTCLSEPLEVPEPAIPFGWTFEVAVSGREIVGSFALQAINSRKQGVTVSTYYGTPESGLFLPTSWMAEHGQGLLDGTIKVPKEFNVDLLTNEEKWLFSQSIATRALARRSQVTKVVDFQSDLVWLNGHATDLESIREMVEVIIKGEKVGDIGRPGSLWPNPKDFRASAEKQIKLGGEDAWVYFVRSSEGWSQSYMSFQNKIWPLELIQTLASTGSEFDAGRTVRHTVRNLAGSPDRNGNLRAHVLGFHETGRVFIRLGTEDDVIPKKSIAISRDELEHLEMLEGLRIAADIRLKALVERLAKLHP